MHRPDTCVETDATFLHTVTHTWNHGLGEIVTALLQTGLRLTSLVRHDSVPWTRSRDRWSKGNSASGG